MFTGCGCIVYDDELSVNFNERYQHSRNKTDQWPSKHVFFGTEERLARSGLQPESFPLYIGKLIKLWEKITFKTCLFFIHFVWNNHGMYQLSDEHPKIPAQISKCFICQSMVTMVTEKWSMFINSYRYVYFERVVLIS